MKRKTVLIVEDEVSVIKALTIKFKEEKIKSIVAKNGVEGLRVALRNHPDLILVDVVIPRMDGITMLQKIRKDSWGETVPVILLTNLSEPKGVAEGVELKAKDYLVKTDWDIRDVVEKVKNRLK